jgi:hypothetical protein
MTDNIANVRQCVAAHQARSKPVNGIVVDRDFRPIRERAAEVNAISPGADFRAFADKCFEVVPQPGCVVTVVEDWHFLSATLFVGHLLDDEPRIPNRMRVDLIARVASAMAMCCAQERERVNMGMSSDE